MIYDIFHTRAIVRRFHAAFTVYTFYNLFITWNCELYLTIH